MALKITKVPSIQSTVIIFLARYVFRRAVFILWSNGMWVYVCVVWSFQLYGRILFCVVRKTSIHTSFAIIFSLLAICMCSLHFAVCWETKIPIQRFVHSFSVYGIRYRIAIILGIWVQYEFSCSKVVISNSFAYTTKYIIDNFTIQSATRPQHRTTAVRMASHRFTRIKCFAPEKHEPNRKKHLCYIYWYEWPKIHCTYYPR